MKKIIWIDVGTNLAQEYNSVFKGNSWFFIKIIRTILSCIVRRNYFIGFKTIYSIYILRKKLQKYKSNFRVAFIEANSLHFRHKEYYLADDTFCLALADKSSDDFKIGLLYFANSDSKSQGNSIYTSKSNISESDFLLTSIVSAEAFTKSYKILLDSTYKDYEVIVRMNCEGSEDSVIYAFTRHFGDKFNHVFGSLKDVKDIKGEASYSRLMSHLQLNKIKFTNFSSMIDTWHEAHKEILKIASNSKK